MEGLALIPALACTLDAAPPAAKDPAPRGACAVCGMQVAPFPDWAAVVDFKDGSQAWFDGPKDLFHFLTDLPRYARRRTPGDIVSIRVKDYYQLRLIDARKALFVLGSDVRGPMGTELVPFASEAAAQEFLKDHRGRRILGFQDISARTLQSLD